jgi:hypothetical protein
MVSTFGGLANIDPNDFQVEDIQVEWLIGKDYFHQMILWLK